MKLKATHSTKSPVAYTVVSNQQSAMASIFIQAFENAASAIAAAHATEVAALHAALEASCNAFNETKAELDALKASSAAPAAGVKTPAPVSAPARRSPVRAPIPTGISDDAEIQLLLRRSYDRKYERCSAAWKKLVAEGIPIQDAKSRVPFQASDEEKKAMNAYKAQQAKKSRDAKRAAAAAASTA